jgi:hypothetical protein
MLGKNLVRQKFARYCIPMVRDMIFALILLGKTSPLSPKATGAHPTP